VFGLALQYSATETPAEQERHEAVIAMQQMFCLRTGPLEGAASLGAGLAT
jgi:hypothetical protein